MSKLKYFNVIIEILREVNAIETVYAQKVVC